MIKQTLPDWFPKNPYPKDIFTLEIEEIKNLIPDEYLRTRIAGCLGRFFWDMISQLIYEAYKNHKDELNEK